MRCTRLFDIFVLQHAKRLSLHGPVFISYGTDLKRTVYGSFSNAFYNLSILNQTWVLLDSHSSIRWLLQKVRAWGRLCLPPVSHAEAFKMDRPMALLRNRPSLDMFVNFMAIPFVIIQQARRPLTTFTVTWIQIVNRLPMLLHTLSGKTMRSICRPRPIFAVQAFCRATAF